MPASLPIRCQLPQRKNQALQSHLCLQISALRLLRRIILLRAIGSPPEVTHTALAGCFPGPKQTEGLLDGSGPGFAEPTKLCPGGAPVWPRTGPFCLLFLCCLPSPGPSLLPPAGRNLHPTQEPRRMTKGLKDLPPAPRPHFHKLHGPPAGFSLKRGWGKTPRLCSTLKLFAKQAHSLFAHKGTPEDALAGAASWAEGGSPLPHSRGCQIQQTEIQDRLGEMTNVSQNKHIP